MTKRIGPEGGDEPRPPEAGAEGDGPHPAEATLHDYVDGSLPARARRRVAAHASTCLTCRSEIESLAALTGDLAKLPREVPPERDLLPGVAARLGAKTAPLGPRVLSSPWPHRYRLAAAAVALIALVSFLTATLDSKRGTDPAGAPTAAAPAPVAPGQIRTAAATGPAASFPEVEAEYVAAIGEIVETLERRRDELSPATVRILEESLSLIDRALAEARDALERDPGNPLVRDVLVAAYEQKLDLLRRAAVVAATG